MNDVLFYSREVKANFIHYKYLFCHEKWLLFQSVIVLHCQKKEEKRVKQHQVITA